MSRARPMVEQHQGQPQQQRRRAVRGNDDVGGSDNAKKVQTATKTSPASSGQDESARAIPNADEARTKKTKSRRSSSGRSLAASIRKAKAEDHRMTVEKGVVDELLLVCGVIGTTTNEGDELVPVADCLNWLQDLQRALRRDDDSYRPISLLIGKWKVVQQKLLPLIMTCRYDTSIVLTVVKILVILTKPLADNTKRAGKMIIDMKKAMALEQVKLRENALEQASMLMEYKKAVVHHVSHHGKSKAGKGLLSVLVSLLAEPLSRTGAARTDTDHLTIELVLHLIRNLLSVEPLINASTGSAKDAKNLHNELIALCDRELVMEILLVICQEMEARENAQYNLLVMELMNLILKSHDPTACARPDLVKKGTVASAQREGGSSANRASRARDATNAGQALSQSTPHTGGSLSSKLRVERARMKSLAGPRHAHFGGTWMKRQADGRTSYFGATQTPSKNTSKGMVRQNRKASAFIGSDRTTMAHSADCHSIDDGPATNRARKAINSFCERFVQNCYGPVMKSLKNEFRRDSARLESGDKCTFFRLIWFFSQWWRMRHQDDGSNAAALGNLIFTMDVFTFNLVLNAADTYAQTKHFPNLAQTVALYSEMVQLLHSMFKSDDSTETVMALGLMDRLFYASEPLDRLPKLLQSWTHGASTREYLCDLADLTHVTLNLLDANESECKKLQAQNITPHDAITKMRAEAADFEVSTYFLRKIVSKQFIAMFTSLLERYSSNSTTVNDHVVALFQRFLKIELASADDGADPDAPKTLFKSKKVTMEPLLYNIHLFLVMEKVLNDTEMRRKPGSDTLVDFAANLMHSFSVAANSNPLLFVEILFRPNNAGTFCESVTNCYVSEELRMIAERDALLEEQRRLLEADEDYAISGGTGNRGGDDDGDDDDDVEFDDSMVSAGGVHDNDQSNKSARSEDDDDSDDESDDDEEEELDFTEDSTVKGSTATATQQALSLNKDDGSDDGSAIAGATQATASSDTEKTKRARDNDTTSPSSAKKPRLSKAPAIEDDDSDDDIEFDTVAETDAQEQPTANHKSQSTRRIIDDDDSDDE